MNNKIEKLIKNSEDKMILVTMNGCYMKGDVPVILTLCTQCVKQLLRAGINEKDFKLALKLAKLDNKELDKLCKRWKEEVENGK